MHFKPSTQRNPTHSDSPHRLIPNGPCSCYFICPLFLTRGISALCLTSAKLYSRTRTPFSNTVTRRSCHERTWELNILQWQASRSRSPLPPLNGWFSSAHNHPCQSQQAQGEIGSLLTLSGSPWPCSLVTYWPSSLRSSVRRPFLEFFPGSVMGCLYTSTFGQAEEERRGGTLNEENLKWANRQGG